ncbi:MAG TPA: alpha-1,4-glucan--maltose-1-phosphate maltosyltransferase [Acidimicrobiales bacterium]|nr:alpha-1,4-glucan--maltose-1-phosphate maltosyltransferase [Acidimicrobiales bacterium]
MSDARPATGRLVIEGIRPATPNGYPAKAVVGEVVRVSADIFKDGHDLLAAQVRWRPCGNGKWSVAPMRELGNDSWEAVVEPTTLGLHEFVVEAWTDRYATWRHKIVTKLSAGQEIDLELEEGARLFEQRAALASGGDGAALDDLAAALRDGSLPAAERLAPALGAETPDLLAGPAGAADLTPSAPFPLWVDRERALVGAWYELFPRSFGGLAGAADHLPAIAQMGFDIVYLPPVHPIGRTARKGPNNDPAGGPDAVGSPWAIGGPEGGHTALHPDLGTFDDFDALVAAARDLGMEIALDYALQCSPDHPWVAEHPEWFHHRPDGSIAYAENPPKKYQDIYPLNFWPDEEGDRQALWDACKEILDFWIGHGVRVFRVDNPHTKPVAFWEWLLPAVQAEHPDVLFLAEAFTRPKVMARLAEVGFSQSYTYFTWRTGRWELQEYLEELAHGPKADYMRPNFWPNTPDILSGPLRDGPPAAFRQRLVLAATLTPSYGIYSGYELCENRPASDTNEEYLNSEKYEIKHRDYGAPGSLAPLVTLLNNARRRHPALQRLRNIHFHGADNPDVIVYSKHTDDRSDVVLTVVSLDPHDPVETTLDLDLALLGLPWDRPFFAFDELSFQSFMWAGNHPYVRLTPDQAAHVLHLRTTQ